MYELLQVLTFTRSQLNTITLQLPYQLSACSHYNHSLSVTFLCPPRLPPRTGFYGAPRTCPCVTTPRGRAHVPARLTSIKRHRTRQLSWSRHQFPRGTCAHVQTCLSRDPHAVLECADPRPSWIGSNTGLAYKSPPQVNRYTCWAGSAPTPTTHAAIGLHVWTRPWQVC